MTDFPRSLLDFPCRFASEEPCAAWRGRAQPSGQDADRRRGRGRRPGRLRLAGIADFSAASLHALLRDTVALGAAVKTDGWSGYPGASGVAHEAHTIEPMAAHLVPPWVHRVFANLKRWALGVYHGLRRAHLQADLDEFAFRFNRRRTRPAAFRCLLGIALAIKPITYKMLIAPELKG